MAAGTLVQWGILSMARGCHGYHGYRGSCGYRGYHAYCLDRGYHDFGG